jgi:hypothetical protein
MAQAVGQARRLAPSRELALASQVVKAQECPAAAYQDKGCQTWQFYPAIGYLEAEHRARRPARAPHDPMGSRLLEQGQALEAQAMTPATRGILFRIIWLRRSGYLAFHARLSQWTAWFCTDHREIEGFKACPRVTFRSRCSDLTSLVLERSIAAGGYTTMVKLSIILAAALSPVFAMGVQAQGSAAGLPEGPAKGMVCQSASKFDPRSASNSDPADIDALPPFCGLIRSGS